MRKSFAVLSAIAVAALSVACVSGSDDDAGDNDQLLPVLDAGTSKPDAITADGQVVAAQDIVLKPGYSEPADRFGAVLAVSTDGSVLVVGAPAEAGAGKGVNGAESSRGAAGRGAAFVYRKNKAGAWAQEAYLKPSNVGINPFAFGTALAISGDGNVIVVGAPGEDSDSKGVASTPSGFLAGAGAAYAFSYEEGRWSQTAYIKSAAPVAKGAFGSAVSLNQDGSLLAVSTPTEASAGRVYTYKRAAKVWTASSVIKVPSGTTGTSFGVALAMSADGRTIAIGADKGTPSGGNKDLANAGLVHVFGSDAKSVWTLQATVSAPSARAAEGFGTVLAVSADGSLLAAGIPGEKGTAKGVGGSVGARDANCATGAVQTFARTGTAWAADTYIKAARPACADTSGDRFGASLSFGSANDLLVGAPGVGDAAAAARGEVHSFARSANVWSLTEEWIAVAPKQGQGSGLSVASSGAVITGTRDGTVLVLAQ